MVVDGRRGFIRFNPVSPALKPVSPVLKPNQPGSNETGLNRFHPVEVVTSHTTPPPARPACLRLQAYA